MIDDDSSFGYNENRGSVNSAGRQERHRTVSVVHFESRLKFAMQADSFPKTWYTVYRQEDTGSNRLPLHNLFSKREAPIGIIANGGFPF